jgi:hypothetical protein
MDMTANLGRLLKAPPTDVEIVFCLIITREAHFADESAMALGGTR